MKKKLIGIVAFLLVLFVLGSIFLTVCYKKQTGKPVECPDNLKSQYTLLQKEEEPKIIIAGGDNAAQGYIETVMKKSLGMQVFNMGISGQDGVLSSLSLCKDSIKPKDIIVVIPDYETQISGSLVTKEFTEYLTEYRQYVESKQAHIVLSYPSVQAEKITSQNLEISDYKNELVKQTGITSVAYPQDYLYEATYFDATTNHLNQKGIEKRTNQLVENIQSCYGDDILFSKTNGEYKNQQIVFMGDSIVGNARDETSITAILSRRLNTDVYNGAFGGSCMSSGNEDLRSTFVENSFSMCNLAEAMVYKDFTVQKSDVVGNRLKSSYFEETVSGLSKIDFAKVDVLLLEQGTNDYNSGKPLDDSSNPYNKNTYGGAIRYSLSVLQKEYPDLRIILCTPTYSNFSTEENPESDCTNTDYGYGTLKDFMALEQEIGTEYKVEVIDNFSQVGIDQTNYKEYTFDGLHLNDKGCRLFAQNVTEYLLNHPE